MCYSIRLFSLLFIIPFLLHSIFVTEVYAHKEYVHQYLSIEAYRLLELRFPGLAGSPLGEHLGTQSGGCDGMPFSTGLITAGAYREDCEDPVFHYGDLIPFLDEAYFSASHFWDADEGDHSTIEICDLSCAGYENAYQKSLRYVLPGRYGRWTAKLSWPVGQAFFHLPGGGTTWIVQYGQIGFEYDNLISFYRDGICRINGYLDVTGQWMTPSTLPDRLPIEIVASQSVRERIAWEVIGRLSHLIGDLGVPAHSHNDIHPPFWWNNEHADIFEEEIGALYTAWDYLDAERQGGVLDPFAAVRDDDYGRHMRYLFYATSQVADRFPSNDADGDALFQTTWGEDDYTVLDIIDSVDVSPTDRSRFLPEAADYSFVFSIRAIAGLYLWFAAETGILNTFTINTNFPGGYLLVDGKPRTTPLKMVSYAGSTVRLTAPLQTYTDLQTGIPYNMEFGKWTWSSPSGTVAESRENPLDVEPPTGATVTAEYVRSVEIVFTAPRHLDGGTGATYRVNGLDRGTSWSAIRSEADSASMTVEMIMPPGCVFIGWSDGVREHPRVVTAARPLNVYGLYKLHLRTNAGSAGTRPSGRLIASTGLTGPGENGFVMVYESSGNIYYCGSRDGIQWDDEELVNDGNGMGSRPSIEYFANTPEGVSGAYVVWARPAVSGTGFEIMGRVRNRENSTWGQVRKISSGIAAPYDGSGPVVSDNMILWRGEDGLEMTRFFGDRVWTVPGSDSLPSEAVFDADTRGTGDVAIVWTRNSKDIMFARFTTEQEMWTTPLVVAGGNGETRNSGPSVAIDGNGLACVAWIGGTTGNRHVSYRYIDRENVPHQAMVISGCPLEENLPVALSITHYRSDIYDRRDIDLQCFSPGSGRLMSLFKRSGGAVGPLLTETDATVVSFPLSGRKMMPGNVIIHPGKPADQLRRIETLGIRRETGVPIPPRLLAPTSGIEISGSTIHLRWMCSPDAAAYHVQVAENEDFSSAVGVDISGITVEEYNAMDLRPGIRYYWRVTASNESGEGPFSETRAFTTTGTPPPPSLSGTTVIYGSSRYPSLSWTPVTGATGYRLLRYVCTGKSDCWNTARHESVYHGSARSFIDRNTPVSTKFADSRVWFTVIAEKVGISSAPSNKISYGTSGSMTWGNIPQHPARELPEETALFPNYPNPFNPTTRIQYQLATAGHVRLTVYNIIGEVVTTLVNGESEPGYFSVELDATGYAPGIYFLELLFPDNNAGGVGVLRQKMVFLK